MCKRAVVWTCLALLVTASAFAQGLDTQANSGDWEEINFEFDSSVLVDGFPSLLRLAELLNQNSEYRVTLEGHADYRGADDYNVRLSQARAQTVRDFLLKYGARENQVAITPRGEQAPRIEAQNPEALFMNRRVVMRLADGQGRLISAGSVGDAIEAMQDISQQQMACCDQIMSELSKLDEILHMLKDLQGENQELKQEVADLRDRQGSLEQNVTQLAEAPPPPTKEEVQEAVKASLPPPSRKFSILGLNVGPDTNDSNLAGSGRGRIFLPFAQRHAVQVEGEYMHYSRRDEGQIDAGLVSRFGNVQVGLFGSFRHVRLGEFQYGGSMAQSSATLDYVFDRGRVGAYGTRGFMDGAVLNRISVWANTVEESYLSIVDQVGFSTAFAAWGDAWYEGNFGALFGAGDNKVGGSIRYIHPLSESIAFTAEAGLNETLISNSNSGRFVVGLQFGGWLSPKDYSANTSEPVPVDIPRVRYEVLTRQTRTGNDSPVADAGADQIGVDPGEVTLNGSASYDPDEDPITYDWVQVTGPTVQLSKADTAQPTFTAAEGETYHFHLTVRDDRGGVGTDRTTVSALDQGITIAQFTATPLTIDSGEAVSLVWEIRNASAAEISSVGEVDPSAGSTTVTVTETTTFTLTASNDQRSLSQSVTVMVGSPVQIIDFTADPLVVANPGDPVTLSWKTENATRVNITGVGAVDANGSIQVYPNADTTYNLLASDGHNQVQAVVIVRVEPNAAPVAVARTWSFIWERTIRLDGSRSFDPDGDSITYSWSSIGPLETSIRNPNSETSVVDFLGGPGAYSFELVVTDDKGAKSSPKRVTVHWVGQ